MVQDKLSAFLPPACACVEMTGAGATIPSQQQASAGLSGDLGGKGAKDRALLGRRCVDGRREPRNLCCGGQRSGCGCEEKLQIDQIVDGKTLGPLSGSCHCLSGLHLVTVGAGCGGGQVERAATCLEKHSVCVASRGKNK